MSDNLSGPPTDQRKSAYADDARQLTRLGQFCYVLICLHVLFFDYIAVAHHTIYDFLTMKEGTVEILTSVAFLLGSVMLFAAALAERRLLPRCAYVLGGITLLFFGGEEISWGQSIIGFETPDFLADLNNRGEANIHNTSAFGYVLDSNQRPALLTLCIAACAVSVIRKNRVLGIPAPSILLTLAFLVTMSHFYPPSYRAAFNFENFTLQHRGLFLLLLMVALLSMNARLFIAVGASWSLSSLTDYVFHHHWSHHGALLPFAEISEYLFSLCCLLYALHLLLDQKAARQKIASAGAAIKSAAALPSIRKKTPPPPPTYGANANPSPQSKSAL